MKAYLTPVQQWSLDKAHFTPMVLLLKSSILGVITVGISQYSSKKKKKAEKQCTLNNQHSRAYQFDGEEHEKNVKERKGWRECGVIPWSSLETHMRVIRQM